MERSALGRAATLRRLAVGAAKPLLLAPIDPVVPALGDHQVGVRIVLIAIGISAGVDSNGVGQSLLRRQLPSERPDEFLLFATIEPTRQGEVGANVEATVLALIEIGGVP